MRIESDIKLGFKDVMIRPKRSTLKSRAEVSLIRKFHFRHGENEWEGIPIIAANMDTVGTFEMARVLAAQQLITAIHKHYTVEQWTAFMQSAPAGINNYICLSTGTSKADADRRHVAIPLGVAMGLVSRPCIRGNGERLRVCRVARWDVTDRDVGLRTSPWRHPGCLQHDDDDHLFRGIHSANPDGIMADLSVARSYARSLPRS